MNHSALSRRAAAAVLAAALLAPAALSALPAGAAELSAGSEPAKEAPEAPETSAPKIEVETETEAETGGKEEILYANLTAGGALKEAYAVNRFPVTAGQTLTDHGDYTTVRNMTTTDPIQYENGVVTITAAEDGVIYYEGAMSDPVLPWQISLQYFLDGEELSPEELAGGSGHLKIRMNVAQNPDCTGSFYDNYALQVNFTLDTALAENISAPGGTLANVGSDKQITYILLPGQPTELEIDADVTDFAMDPVAINGLKMQLKLELEGEDLSGKLTQLTDGTADLDEGAKALEEGILQVQQGLDTLASQSGNLVNGSAQVKAALAQIQTALNGVSGSTKELQTLLDGSAQIQAGIAELDAGAAQLESQVSYEAYKALVAAQGQNLDDLVNGNAEAISQLKTLCKVLPNPLRSQLEQVVVLLEGHRDNLNGIQQYLDTVNAGLKTLHQGTTTLNQSYAAFDAGIRQLADTLTGMVQNLALLTGGINTLASEYSALDSGIGAYTDGVAQLKAGAAQLAEGSAQLTAGTSQLYSETHGLDADGALSGIMSLLSGGETPQSFTSAENGEVEAVQFVIQTEAIRPAAPAAEPEAAPAPLNFWQKLLKLFGLYKG